MIKKFLKHIKYTCWSNQKNLIKRVIVLDILFDTIQFNFIKLNIEFNELVITICEVFLKEEN